MPDIDVNLENGKNLWSNLLQEVKEKSSKSTHIPTSLLVLGNEGSGKSSLIARLQNTDVKQGVGLEFDFIEVKDESTDESKKLNVWISSGDTYHANLLKYALNENNFGYTCCLITVSISEPWNLIDSLEEWLGILKKHIDRLKLNPKDIQFYKDSLVRQFQYYSEPIVKEAQTVIGKRRDTDFNYLHPSTTEDPEKILIPLEEGILESNLGIPIIVVITKTDSIFTLEQDFDYNDDKFDFIQMHLRKICLKYGAALCYTSLKDDRNFDLLLKYIFHRCYGFSMDKSASIVDKDAIFIPVGWDNNNKINILSENLIDDIRKQSYSTLINKPLSIVRANAQNRLTEPEVAEDEQVFLMRQQALIQRMKAISSTDGNIKDSSRTGTTMTPSPSTRSRKNLTGFNSTAGVTSTPGAQPGNEGVLANFFSSLLNKRGVSTGSPLPNQQPNMCDFSRSDDPVSETDESQKDDISSTSASSSNLNSNLILTNQKDGNEGINQGNVSDKCDSNKFPVTTDIVDVNINEMKSTPETCLEQDSEYPSTDNFNENSESKFEHGVEGHELISGEIGQDSNENVNDNAISENDETVVQEERNEHDVYLKNVEEENDIKSESNDDLKNELSDINVDDQSLLKEFDKLENMSIQEDTNSNLIENVDIDFKSFEIANDVLEEYLQDEMNFEKSENGEGDLLSNGQSSNVKNVIESENDNLEENNRDKHTINNEVDYSIENDVNFKKESILEESSELEENKTDEQIMIDEIEDIIEKDSILNNEYNSKESHELNENKTGEQINELEDIIEKDSILNNEYNPKESHELNENKTGEQIDELEDIIEKDSILNNEYNSKESQEFNENKTGEQIDELEDIIEKDSILNNEYNSKESQEFNENKTDEQIDEVEIIIEKNDTLNKESNFVENNEELVCESNTEIQDIKDEHNLEDAIINILENDNIVESFSSHPNSLTKIENDDETNILHDTENKDKENIITDNNNIIDNEIIGVTSSFEDKLIYQKIPDETLNSEIITIEENKPINDTNVDLSGVLMENDESNKSEIVQNEKDNENTVENLTVEIESESILKESTKGTETFKDMFEDIENLDDFNNVSGVHSINVDEPKILNQESGKLL